MCSLRVWLWCIQSSVHSVSVVNSYRQSALRYLVRLGDVYTVRCFVEWGVGNILLFSSFCRWKETSWEQRILVWKTGFVSITESTCRLLIAPVIIVLLCKGVDSMTNVSLEVMAWHTILGMLTPWAFSFHWQWSFEVLVQGESGLSWTGFWIFWVFLVLRDGSLTKIHEK